MAVAAARVPGPGRTVSRRGGMSSPVLDEGQAESDPDTPNEPVTPVSTRASQDCENQDTVNGIAPDFTSPSPLQAPPTKNMPLQLTATTTSTTSTPTASSGNTKGPNRPSLSSTPSTTAVRAGKGSTASLKRVMTGLSGVFHGKRQNPQPDKASAWNASIESAPVFNAVNFGVNDAETSTVATAPAKTGGNRFSLHRSGGSTCENSPASPCSPLDTVAPSEDTATLPTVPAQDDFTKKKLRASTGLSLRGRVINFAQQHQPGRRKSVEHAHRQVVTMGPVKTQIFNEREVKDQEADVGAGVKARRLSLSLPDDFAVDVIDLHAEFDFEHKWRGRHNRIGKGANSKISTVHRKGFPDELYACKEFRKKEGYETQLEYQQKVKSEFTIGKSLHHPNIVESVRLCTDHGRWNYVMEYCKGGDLLTLCQMKYLQQEDRAPDRACLVKQLIQGVAYLHRNGIAHRDIKLENLLLTEDSKLKITDFGVSDVFCGIHPGLREAGGQCGVGMQKEVKLCSPGICGSIPYMAPEVFAKKGPYDPRPIDVWSVGMCVTAIVFGGTIWSVPDPGKSASFKRFLEAWRKFYAKNGEDYIISEKLLNFPIFEAFEFGVKSPSLRRLLWRMLNPDPVKRITAEEIVQTRWFKNTPCCQPESYDEPVCGIDTTKIAGLNLKKRTVIHNHRPPVHHASHSLGKMPGQVGY